MAPEMLDDARAAGDRGHNDGCRNICPVYNSGREWHRQADANVNSLRLSIGHGANGHADITSHVCILATRNYSALHAKIMGEPYLAGVNGQALEIAVRNIVYCCGSHAYR